MRSRTKWQIAAIALALGACGTDLGNIAILEQAAVSSAVIVGKPLASADAALQQQGYECTLSSGNFVVESGETASAPSFLACSKQTKGNVVCSIHIQVIVVPEGNAISRVHFSAGDVCL